MTFDVELPLPPKELSPNSSAHYMAKARAGKKHRAECAWAFRAARPKGWEGNSPIEIDVVYRAFRGCNGFHAYDLQNAMASLKHGVDGLVDAGVIPSDSNKWLRWGHFRLVTTKREARGVAGVFVRVRRA